jgi:DNA-binding beta-propeller fold protein YncE
MGASGNKRRGVMFAGLVIVVAAVFGWAVVERLTLPVTPGSAANNSGAQLVSVAELPNSDSCSLETVDVSSTMVAKYPQNTSLFSLMRDNQVFAAGQNGGTTNEVTRPPLRTIRDTYPIYSSVAVDPIRDEIILQDTNIFSIRVFNRLENTPRGVEAAEPKRVIIGDKTDIEYNNGLYVDPKNGEIYSVAMDTADSLFVFGPGANGDVAPIRRTKTPHRNFATAVDEEKGEVFVSIQYPPKVVVHRKMANGEEKPLRVIEGPKTQLYDTHGLAIDKKNNLLYVGSWGNDSTYTVAGTGQWHPPSINVFPLDASGDVAPIRIIQGDKTTLNWMGGFTLDPDSGDLWVANDVGGSVLVFKTGDNGNVAPSRVLKGDRTGLNHPAGIAIDTKNKEIWVSNMGNSSATAYPLTANGNVAPIRTIRSAPEGRVSLKFGKPQVAAYDSKRQQLILPNCVNTPQIAIYSRLAKENTLPVRVIEGQKTLISRTMHYLQYNEVHDEIVVSSPFNQAILTFRGDANGEEPPIRVIRGPKTEILGTDYDGNDKATVDGINGEIYIPTATNTSPYSTVLVFDRLADGDVAPKRKLGGPDVGIRGTRAGHAAVAIDAHNNLLVVKSPGGGGLLMFDRTASGNTKPLRIINGPKSGIGGGGNGLQTYGQKQMIITSCADGAVCAFSIHDNGDVAPRYRIPARQITGIQASGLAINPLHKEVYLPSGAGNVVMTFYWPEVFTD